MKKYLYLLIIYGLISIVTGCIPSSSEPVSEPCFPYKIDLNVTNESATSKEISTQAYSLFDYHGDHDAQYLYDNETVSISGKTSDIFSIKISDALCAEPYLSHIITIGEKNFAGFDTDLYEIEDYVENTHKKITSVKKNLGSVNWRDSKFPVITYEGKTFETDKKFHEIKLIYTIIIRDEADISDSEKDEYVDGIKISVAHEVK